MQQHIIPCYRFKDPIIAHTENADTAEAIQTNVNAPVALPANAKCALVSLWLNTTLGWSYWLTTDTHVKRTSPPHLPLH